MIVFRYFEQRFIFGCACERRVFVYERDESRSEGNERMEQRRKPAPPPPGGELVPSSVFADLVL